MNIEIDEIGKMFTSAEFNELGEIITPAVEMDGWHVNSTEVVLDWSANRVNPVTPRRAFAGVDTFFYTFKDEASYLSIKELTDLTIPEIEQFDALSRIQVRKVLNKYNLRDTVETYMATAPREIQDEWKFRDSYERNNQLLLSVAELLNITDSQLNSMFREGKLL